MLGTRASEQATNNKRHQQDTLPDENNNNCSNSIVKQQVDSEENSTTSKLIKRRTIRRYLRSTEQQVEQQPTARTSSTAELTISINKPTAGSSFKLNSPQQQQQDNNNKNTSFSSLSSLTPSSSSSKIARSSSTITTNSKFTTHRKQINQSAESSSSSSSSSSSLSLENNSCKSIEPIRTTTTTTTITTNNRIRPQITRLAMPSLELRLSNQRDSLFDRKQKQQVSSEQQEESSRVHHSSRQSFSSSSTSSSTSTSLRAGSLRKSSAISSSLAAAASTEAALLSRHSSSVTSLAAKNGSTTTTATGQSLAGSSDLTSATSSSSTSSRHFKSSLTVSGHSSKATTTTSTAVDEEVVAPTTVFLNSEALFASPDVRSLVKEIGTDFAELENALSSTTGSAFGAHNNRGISSLSSRLFGANSAISSLRRPTSPCSLLPAITSGRSSAASSANSPDRTRDRSPSSGITEIGFGSRRLSQLSCNNQRRVSPDFGTSCDTIQATNPSGEVTTIERVTTTLTGSRGDRIKELMSKAQGHNESTSSSNLKSRFSFGSSGGGGHKERQITITEEIDQPPPPPSSSPFGGSNSSGSSSVAKQQAAASVKEKQADKSHRKAVMTESIERIDQRMSDLCKKFNECHDTKEAIDLLKIMIQMIEKAWSVPVCGDDLGFKLCNSLREAGGLDIILGFIQENELISHAELADLAAPSRAHSALWAPMLFEDPSAKLPAPEVAQNEDQSSASCEEEQPSSERVKKKSMTNPPLRLNLSKLNPEVELTQSEKQRQHGNDSMTTASSSSTMTSTKSSIDADNSGSENKSTSTATVVEAAIINAAALTTTTKDSDSDIITSDLGFDSASGLDSASLESLSYQPQGEEAASQQLPVEESTGSEEAEPSGAISETTRADQPLVDESQDKATEPEVETAEEKQKEASGERVAQQIENKEEANESDGPEVEVPIVLGEAEVAAAAEDASLMKEELVFLSARLLSQCLTSENRNYMVDNGLDQVIKLACLFITMKSTQRSRRLLARSVLMHQSSGIKSSQASNSEVKRDNIQQRVGKTQEAGQVQGASSKSSVVVTGSGQDNWHNDFHAIIGTEILQHLFKHSEDTCRKIISLGGLDAILFGCRSSNVEILRHCASALANLALYGGPEGQQTMIEQKAHVWLFPLAFHEDDNIQYYACLAIVVLVANQEIEADVLKSSTLNLVEPFVTSHEPQRFAESATSHVHGQSASWLRKLIPLLESKREEARNLACFHFAMEAHIKREQGQTHLFKEIGAVDPLRKVGSSPIALASRFACQALRLIGEKEPHKLSQQVPLWTSDDVIEWVSQIGFERFKAAFVESRVDGDLLLQLDEDMLKTDIGIENGIIRRRFLRELSELKRIADYSSADKSGLGALFQASGHNEGSFIVQYIYPMIQLGVTKDNIHLLDGEQLLRECKVANAIHRMKLAHAIKDLQERMASAAASQEFSCLTNGSDGPEKTLDVFVSYRRSTGSQLASLLKVHLQLRGFSVFIDVERLEAGKFDNNLLDSIKAAKNFILVLSPNALDRCINDRDCKDWVHKEIVAALASNCNIIPIIDNFHWPEAEQLPEDMRSISYFNGIRWIHDYQDACVDKVERFIRGEINQRAGSGGGVSGGLTCLPMGAPQTAQSMQSNQRLTSGGGGSTYSSTPSVIATPSMANFPSGGSTSAYSRPPFDADHHPLSFANCQYMLQSTGSSRQHR